MCAYYLCTYFYYLPNLVYCGCIPTVRCSTPAQDSVSRNDCTTKPDSSFQKECILVFLKFAGCRTNCQDALRGQTTHQSGARGRHWRIIQHLFLSIDILTVIYPPALFQPPHRPSLGPSQSRRVVVQSSITHHHITYHESKPAREIEES